MNDIIKYNPPDQHYIQLDIVFATAYGVNEALLFAKLHRLQERMTGQVDEVGNKWIRLMLTEWKAELPFLEEMTIRRTIAKCEEQKLILSRTFAGRCKWYRVNPAYVSVQNEQSQMCKMNSSNVQNEQLPIVPPNSFPKSSNNGANAPAPAVETYRSVAKRFPDSATWPDIANTVGEEPDNLAFWENVVRQYIGCGWNKLNIVGMLEFYRKRILPSTKPQERTNGHNGQTEVTPTTGSRLTAAQLKRVQELNAGGG